MLDSGPTVKHVKIGDKIEIEEHVHGEEDERISVYVVIGVYPHMVLAEKKNHVRRCFSYGDLIKEGLERQSDELEALRKFDPNTAPLASRRTGARFDYRKKG